jgi:hypothetical protein
MLGTRALLAAAVLAPLTVAAQDYNVPFRPRAAGGGNPCTGHILTWVNFEGNDNTSPYTTQSSLGEYPNAYDLTYGDGNAGSCTDGHCMQTGSAKNGTYGYHVDGDNSHWFRLD